MIEQPPGSPWELLTEWLPSNDDPERPVMTVATVDVSGVPDARSQLLSGYDNDGFYLHFDSRSRKVAQLAGNPGVALVLRWPEQLRQLVVQGIAYPAPPEESRWAYEQRSPYLRRLAWLNTEEFAQLSLGERRAAWSAFGEAHGDEVSAPPTWDGRLVRPARLTFWVGDLAAASRRIEYRRSTVDAGIGSAHWEVSILAG